MLSVYTSIWRVKMARKALRKFDHNPLVSPRELVFKERTVKVGSARELVDTSTGEISNVNAVYQRKMVDSEKFAKVYLEGISKTFELGSAARKVFGVVLKCCEKDTDRIYLNFMATQEAGDVDGLSERTFQRGLAELMEKGFLAASTMPSMFWINVHLFFNGDRVKFITEYVKDSSKQAARDPRTVDFIEGKADIE